ncbi:MAG: hypothetical protein L0Z55_07520 [Planctomycetes bacterium]|nr:hypothetical protein [Planctomycetota bacterium]
MERIVAEAEQIVIGKVTAVSPGYFAEWPRVGKIVFTDVTIAVERRWKGEAKEDTITMQVPGGTLEDGQRLAVSDAPSFQAGGRVLLFCSTKRGRIWVHGWDQGKYDMVRERVVGKTGYPIAEDILADPLHRKIAQLLERKGK